MLLNTDDQLNSSVFSQNSTRFSSQDNISERTNPEADHGHPPEMLDIVKRVQGGDSPRSTVRTLLSWFKVQRRGSFIVFWIRGVMQELGISTEPDFDSVWIDSEVTFVPAPTQQSQDNDLEVNGAGFSTALENNQSLAPVFVGGAMDDPTYRVAKLDAANKPVISVTPNQVLEHAVTLMLAHDFSQLPVMQGDREVKGVLTWQGVGASLALGRTCKEAREFMSSPQIISSEMSLFAAVEIIAQHQYVLVQAPDRRITGIITSADLSRQFQQLTEPFLLLSEIEQHIRKLIVDKFTFNELKSACDPNDPNRQIENVTDLTMGEYIRLLENPKHWERLVLRIDRTLFIGLLQTVRRIRNDIMHFDPDPLEPADLLSLRQFVNFMQSLRQLRTF